MHLKVSGKDIDLFEVDKDVSLEIPPGTVIAYSTMELEIEKNGHYGEGLNVWLCVQTKNVQGKLGSLINTAVF